MSFEIWGSEAMLSSPSSLPYKATFERMVVPPFFADLEMGCKYLSFRVSTFGFGGGD